MSNHQTSKVTEKQVHLLAENGVDIWFCAECDRYFDVRCGCEADVRFDEAQRIRREFLAVIVSRDLDDWRDGAAMRAAIDRIVPEE